MMIRTYGRRNRGGIGRTLSVSTLDRNEFDDPFRNPFSFSEEDYEQEAEESSHEVYNFTFSSQDSTNWTFESDPYPLSSGSGQGLSQKVPSLQSPSPINESGSGTTRWSKKVKNGRRESERGPGSAASVPPLQPQGMTTLMETQEFGEMMEHVDEISFSLDGLRRGQPIRVRRGSLLSLLKICGAPQWRRLLRAHGIAKTIIDAIVCLSLDDSPSNLAAAALFYVLTSDGQDIHLLDSDSSIGFLIKFLKPLASDDVVEKAPRTSHKLLSLRKDAHNSVDLTKKVDSSATAIFDKVKEILLTSKDIEVSNEDTDGLTRPELSPKWISLLTMEKACFSTVSLEEGTVRKIGGNFKEILRELGGLDAVFELAMDFCSTLEDWLEHVSTSSGKLRLKENLQCLILLLKCLRIMENATFLSKENQNHLLEMRKYLADQKSSLSFTKLVINFINVLSDLSLLRRNSSTTSSPEVPINVSSDSGHLSELPLMIERKVDSGTISLVRSSQHCSSSGRIFPKMGSRTKRSQSNGWLSSSLYGSLFSSSETVIRAIEDDNSIIKMRINTSKASSCSTTSRSSRSEASVNDDDLKMKPSLGKRPFEDSSFLDIEDSQDPFAFDDEEFRPSKWDLLHGRKNLPRKRKSKLARRNFDEGYSTLMIARQGQFKDSGILTRQGEFKDSGSLSRQGEFRDSDSCQSSQTSYSPVFNEESNNLLSDCLLTAVKVLMNLTNDNDLGCHQIAACGGLKTLSSLIATHFPSFGLILNSSRKMKDCISLIDVGSETDSAPFSDHEIDFLVAILGLLVNLVEKNNDNRSRLASASVLLPCSVGSREENQKSIIPLLCSIFLANQGAGEAVGEGNNEPWVRMMRMLYCKERKRQRR